IRAPSPSMMTRDESAVARMNGWTSVSVKAPATTLLRPADFTMVRSFAGLNASALQEAMTDAAPDPVCAAHDALRSGNTTRIRAALASLPRDPSLIGPLVPLLANRHILRPTVAALKSFGPRAAGEMASALLDTGTPDAVRRRLPAVA
ncbi:MAG: hypothetical protein ABI806_17280, partial [Candidatus Solibacter sp.]